MDCKERIMQLMLARGWTFYELSKRSGLAQTTITNMYKRNTEPTMPTLTAICKGFGITLSQFFAEGNTVELSDEQVDFFNHWVCLTREQKDMLMRMAHSMR